MSNHRWARPVGYRRFICYSETPGQDRFSQCGGRSLDYVTARRAVCQYCAARAFSYPRATNPNMGWINWFQRYGDIAYHIDRMPPCPRQLPETYDAPIGA